MRGVGLPIRAEGWAHPSKRDNTAPLALSLPKGAVATHLPPTTAMSVIRQPIYMWIVIDPIRHTLE